MVHVHILNIYSISYNAKWFTNLLTNIIIFV